jgi:probable addiction module antidote protein
MSNITMTPFDAAKYIRTANDVAALLSDAFASGDAGYIAQALGTIARSAGMTQIAQKSGMNRQALYTALSSEGNPTLETLIAVLAALGFQLKCEPISTPEAA